MLVDGVNNYAFLVENFNLFHNFVSILRFT